MPLRVSIPVPLRPYVGNNESLDVEGRTIGEVLARIAADYPELGRHLYSNEGTLRSFINVRLNDEEMRCLKKVETPLCRGATLRITPSIAGGTAVGEKIALSSAEIQRYSRHLIMPEVGMEGRW